MAGMANADKRGAFDAFSLERKETMATGARIEIYPQARSAGDVCPFPGTNTCETAQIRPIGSSVHSNSGLRRGYEPANRGRCCAFANFCP